MPVGHHRSLGVDLVFEVVSARSVPAHPGRLGLKSLIVEVEVIVYPVKVGTRGAIKFGEIEGAIKAFVFDELTFDVHEDAFLREVLPAVAASSTSVERVVVIAISIDI